MDSLRARAFLRRVPRWGLSLLPALSLAACSPSTMPNLSDLEVGTAKPVATAQPPSAISPPAPKSPQQSAGTNGSQPSGVGVDGPPPRPSRRSDVIVGFKGPTVILFGDEFGNDGERVAVSNLNLPLQARSAATNKTRVQIETAYGPRWVARSELVLGALDGQPPSPR